MNQTKSKYSAFFRIHNRIKAQGLDVERSELIEDFTNGKKQSLQKLTPWEYNELLNWLNRTFPAGEDPKKAQSNQMRRKVIALFRKMGYQENGKADMERIYAWVLKYGILKKAMNEYTHDELPQLVTQVETVYKKHLQSL